MIDPKAVFAADGPAYLNLRKAARIAIVAPSVLAFGLVVIGNDTIATYSVFATFVSLVFADYGGPPRQRAGAYVTMMILSAVAIVVGGLLASWPLAGVVGMFVVMFGATFATVFGGYMALHVAPIALAYSLSVLMAPDQLVIPDRVAGWVFGATVALIAALVLWPIDRRTGLREATASLAGDLGDVIASFGAGHGARERLAAIRSSVESVQTRLSSPLRPYGPAARDVAFVQLVMHLDQAVDLTAEALEADEERPLGHAPDEEPLRGAITAALARTRHVLEGHREPESVASDLARLDAARAAGRASVEAAAAHAVRRGQPTVDDARRALPMLALAHVAMWIESEANRAMGAGRGPRPRLVTAPELADPDDTVRATAERASRFALTELDPQGVILRNSIRAGAALAAAILLAVVLPLEHGFWIALGALGVLRSSAASTSATAVEAVIGTIVGFFVAALMTLLIGHTPALLWLVFPIACFAAAYSPGAIHFVVGQAAFTVMVVALFSIIDAPGFATAVVRVETVTIGALTAAVLSVVLWPRGGRTALGHAVAEVYRAAAAGARTFVTGTEQARLEAEAELDLAWRRAEAAFCALLAEHDEAVDTPAWAAVLQPPMLARSLLSGLVPAVRDEPAGCRAAVTSVSAEAERLRERLAAASARLQPGSGSTQASSRGHTPDDLDPQLERCIDDAVEDETTMLRALSMVGWSVWIDRLGNQLERAQPALDVVAAASASRAWLHR